MLNNFLNSSQLKQYDLEDNILQCFEGSIRGFIFTQEGNKLLLSSLIRRYQRTRGKEEWKATHCGIVGYDGFVWEMVVGGLRYNYIVPRIMKGTKVKIWKPLSIHRVEDATEGIKLIKKLYGAKTKYDFLELITAGMLNPKKSLVCSGLVRRYLAIVNTIKPQPRKLWAGSFFTPADVADFCEPLFELYVSKGKLNIRDIQFDKMIEGKKKGGERV